MWRVCLIIQTPEGLAALYQEYQASGADIVQPPQDYSWGMREMLVRDLDGNTFRMGTMVAVDAEGGAGEVSPNCA